MKKLYVITAPRGGGKSTAIATFPAATPEEMSRLLVVDTEDSQSDNYDKMKAAGAPFDIMRAYERFRPDVDLLDAIAQGRLPWVSSKKKSALVGYYEWFVSSLNKRLETGKYKYLGIDTVGPIEAGMVAWAEVEKRKSGWSGSYVYGRLETEGMRPLYENLVEAIYRRGIEYLLFACHLKRVWENDKPVLNKVKPGGRLSVLSRISSMMLWLTPDGSNADGAPAAIVLKARLGQFTIENGLWRPRRILPERIPHFSWPDLFAYQAHPANLQHPAPGESMTNDERDMISELLSDEQMRLMILGARKDLLRASAGSLTVIPGRSPEEEQEIASLIQGGLIDGMAAPEIIRSIEGATLPLVLRVKRRLAEATANVVENDDN